MLGSLVYYYYWKWLFDITIHKMDVSDYMGAVRNSVQMEKAKMIFVS
jgi:hypothetical protein